jgi:Helix-turn-helix of DDE superfamily endonuclease
VQDKFLLAKIKKLASYLTYIMSNRHQFPHQMTNVKIMLNRYKEIENDEITIRQMTGLRKGEFEDLHQYFQRSWTYHFEHYTLDGRPRTRLSSVRKNSIFGQTEDALLFCLQYVKNKTHQEHLAVQFGIDQPKASRYLKLTQRLLLKTVSNYSKSLPLKKREWLVRELTQ